MVLLPLVVSSISFSVDQRVKKIVLAKLVPSKTLPLATEAARFAAQRTTVSRDAEPRMSLSKSSDGNVN